MKKGDVDIPQHKPGNMAENSMGGTELLTMELFKRLPEEYKNYFQFVISRVNKEDLEDKPRLYWLHDLALDPVHDFLREPEGLNLFDKLIFVSHWQQQSFQNFLRIPYSKGVVIKNAIDPSNDLSKNLCLPKGMPIIAANESHMLRLNNEMTEILYVNKLTQIAADTNT